MCKLWCCHDFKCFLSSAKSLETTTKMIPTPSDSLINFHCIHNLCSISDDRNSYRCLTTVLMRLHIIGKILPCLLGWKLQLLFNQGGSNLPDLEPHWSQPEVRTLFTQRGFQDAWCRGSSQAIFACRAGTGTHETLKTFFLFMFYACISLQNMQTCIAIHFCFPFIEGKCLWHFTKNISQRPRVIVVATCFLGRLNLILARTLRLMPC
jgi:hypothetical protein